MQTPIYIETEKGKYCIGTDGTVSAILDSDKNKLNVGYPHSERYKTVLKSYSKHVAEQQREETEVVCAYYRESDKSLNLHTEKVNFPMTSFVSYFNCMQKKGVNRGEFLGDECPMDAMNWKVFLEQRRIPVDIVRIDGKVIKSRRGIEDGSND